MQKLIALSLILFLPAVSWGASKIDEVVVYADRAKVKRVATAKCSGGAGTAVFEPLPATLDVRTLRGEGPSVIGVSSAIVSDGEPIDERAKKLKAEIQGLQDQVNLTNSALANAQGRAQQVSEEERG